RDRGHGARLLPGRLGRVPGSRVRVPTSSPSEGEAKGAPKTTTTKTEPARAGRAGDRARRGARRRARAPTGGRLGERRSRRGAPRCPRRPRGAPRALGDAVRVYELTTTALEAPSAQPCPPRTTTR